MNTSLNTMSKILNERKSNTNNLKNKQPITNKTKLVQDTNCKSFKAMLALKQAMPMTLVDHTKELRSNPAIIRDCGRSKSGTGMEVIWLQNRRCWLSLCSLTTYIYTNELTDMQTESSLFHFLPSLYGSTCNFTSFIFPQPHVRYTWSFFTFLHKAYQLPICEH